MKSYKEAETTDTMTQEKKITVIEKKTGRRGEFDSSLGISECLFQECDWSDENNPKYYLREGINFSDLKRYYDMLWDLPEYILKSTNRVFVLDYLFSDYFRKHMHALGLYEELYLEYGKSATRGIYRDFANLEQCLYAFFRTRYRDHFLHMFNVFLMGGIILGGISKHIQNGDLDFNAIFKISSEHPKMIDLRNGKKIAPQVRICPIWFYMSTFHDVAYPVETCGFIEEIVSIYREKFFFDIKTSIHRDFRSSSISKRRESYLKQIVSLYECGLEMKENGDYNYDPDRFKFPRESDPILSYIQAKSYGENIDHGVVSAILLLHYISEDGKKQHGKKADIYMEHYVNHDLTRAALAVCLHNLKPEDVISQYDNKTAKSNPLFLIRFDEFPLTFLLILCDELEEWGRPEYIGGFLPAIFPIGWDISFEISEKLVIRITIDLSKADIRDYMEEFIKSKLRIRTANVTESISLAEWIGIIKERVGKRISMGSSDWIEFCIHFKLPSVKWIEEYLMSPHIEMIEYVLGYTEEKTREEFAKEYATSILGTDKNEIMFKIE